MNDFKEKKLKQSFISIPQKNDNCDDLISRELLKLCLKENFSKIIHEGNMTSTCALDELFEKKPDR